MNRRERRNLRNTAQHSSHYPNQQSAPTIEPVPTHIENPGRATGPRTEEGKSVSSRNAVRHGLCAKKLTGIDLENLNAIRSRLDNEWNPVTETENILLAQMALSQWRLERALELELAALDGEIDAAALALALRYRVSAERTFFKSLAELQRLRAVTRQEALRDLQAQNRRDKEIIHQLEAMVLKPPSEFVSQNSSIASTHPHFVSQNSPAPQSNHHRPA
jgi:hypothetical protein